MQLFLELLRESVIMRGVLAVTVVGVWAGMVVVGQPVPEAFTAAGGIILGFFFGSRPVAAVQRADEVAKLKAELAHSKEVG